MEKSKIFYFCHDHSQPSGGNKEIYKHVNFLNKSNYQAFVVHRNSDFKISWFEHQALVISLEEFKDQFRPKYDFVVLPEDLGESILEIPGNKVVFNQNIYYAFHNFLLREVTYPYQGNVKAALVVSRHNQEYMGFAYPELKTFRVYCGVDTTTFAFKPLKEKHKKIVCNPAKRPLDIAFVYHLLQSRAQQGLNILSEYEWIFIEDKTESEVAQILSDALIFIFLSKEEGFPLMLLEAMACGCLIMTYDLAPMSEYVPESFRYAAGDILGIAKRVEAIAQAFAAQTEDLWELQMMAKTGREVALHYSLEHEAQSVVAAWAQILSQVS
jgi:hypothetical protein